MTKNRQPAGPSAPRVNRGVPTGGQFAARPRPEGEVTLDGADPSPRRGIFSRIFGSDPGHPKPDQPECDSCQDSGIIDVQGRAAYQGCRWCGRGITRKAERQSHLASMLTSRSTPRRDLLGDGESIYPKW